MRGVQAIIAVGLVSGLAACGGDPDLVRPGQTGPDEFSVVPNQPLEAPQSYNRLPPPTPGGANRTDRDPRAEAIAALGGNAGAGSGVPQGPALIDYTTRFGTTGDIRQTLAREDLAFRQSRDRRLLERLFGSNLYYDAYAPLSLDQDQALERLRARGVRTPAAPPRGQ